MRNEIYKDIYDRNRWVYVKMQALLEYVNKQYICVSSFGKSMDYKSNMELTLNIIRELGLKSDVEKVFKKINSIANNVKHDQILEGSKYNQWLISSFIDEFNNYCQSLFG